MTTGHGQVVVTFRASGEILDGISEVLEGWAELTFLRDVDEDRRVAVLSSADGVLAAALERELRGADEFAALGSVGLLQLLSAGVDRLPFERIPDAVPVASNAGAYAGPMAEHVVAMTLAFAKHLAERHRELQAGEFNQEEPSRDIRGSVVGILGFGGIGQATGRLFRAFGARIRAINRTGETGEPVEWIGSLAQIDTLLAASDVLVVSLPLNRATTGLIGRRELSLMKPDAILVNVARGAIIDEDALFEHLQATPSFSAGIDTWWDEPRRSGPFATRRPLLELPNVLGSPHNSAITPGALRSSAQDAAENLLRSLRGEPVRNLVRRSDYLA